MNARTANQRALTLLHVGQSTIVAAGIAAATPLPEQYAVADGTSAGDIVLVNACVVPACMPLNTRGFVFRETNDALVNVERMFDIVLARGHRGEDIDESSAQPLVVSAGEIEFENVESGYEPVRQIVVDVTFDAHRGRACRVRGALYRPVGSLLSYVAELPLSPFVVEGPPSPLRDSPARLAAGERPLAGPTIMAIEDQEEARMQLRDAKREADEGSR